MSTRLARRLGTQPKKSTVSAEPAKKMLPMTAPEIRDSALVAAEKIPDLVDGSTPGCGVRKDPAEVLLDGEPNQLRALSPEHPACEIEILRERGRKPDGQLRIHGRHLA